MVIWIYTWDLMSLHFTTCQKGISSDQTQRSQNMARTAAWKKTAGEGYKSQRQGCAPLQHGQRKRA